MSTHDHYITLTYGGLRVEVGASDAQWNAAGANKLDAGPQGERARALNMLIGALRAESQPMVTESGACLLTAVDIEVDGSASRTPVRDLDMHVITAPVRAHGVAGRLATLLLAAQTARREVEPRRRRQHFMPGPEIDGLWWCARCLRFAQSESEDPAASKCSEATTKIEQIRRNREAVERALRSLSAHRQELPAG